MYKSFFFFSSRRRHTRLTCDWSSDVCSSDLIFYKATFASCIAQCVLDVPGYTLGNEICIMHKTIGRLDEYRSEERRVGKEGRCGWLRFHRNKERRVVTNLRIVPIL